MSFDLIPGGFRGRGGGGGKGGGGVTTRAATEAPNTLRSKSTVKVILALSEGEIEGLEDGAKSIFLDDTPLQAADGSYNFQGVTWELRTGTPDQAPPSNISDIEATVAVNLEVLNGTPVVRTITNLDATSARVTARIPTLFYQDPTTGDVVGTSVNIKIEVKPSGGGYATVVDDTIAGKCVSDYERSYRFPLAGTGPWDVRYTRVTANAPSTNYQNKTFWSSLTTIIDLQLRYSDTAILILTFDAQLTGGRIPRVSVRLKGIKCRTPANRDPATRAYTGIWDGTFQVAWTDNPAWVFYEVAANQRFGLGRYLTTPADKWELYEIGQYCDELVPDGYGGWEPRYRFNGNVTGLQEAFVLLMAIASVFRGRFYWGAGTIVPYCDRPMDAEALVIPGNTIKGSIDYGTSSHKSRPTTVRASFNNMDDHFRADVEVYQDDARIITYGYRPTDLISIGTTHRSQAHRLGKWDVETVWTEGETLSYRAGLDHAFVRPGRIVDVMDRSYSGMDYGGRLISATLVTAELDRAVQLDADKSYTLTVTLPDGTLASRAVTNAPGSATTITWVTNLPATPDPNAVWILSSSSLSPRKFRILNVTMADRTTFELFGNFHDPNKYARVENNLILESPSYSAIPTGALPKPEAVVVQEFLYQDATTVQSGAIVSWRPASDPRVRYYALEAKYGDGAFTQVYFGPDATADLRPIVPGTYHFQVQCMDGVGRPGPWQSYGPIEVKGVYLDPSPVTGLSLVALNGQAHLRWDLSPDLDVRVGGRVRVRWSPLTIGASWGSMTDLGPEIAGSAKEATVPLLSGTYALKFIDIVGKESVSATYLVTTLPDVLNRSYVLSIPLHPAWSGTHSNTCAPDGYLQLDSTGDLDAVADFDAVAAFDAIGDAVQPSGTWTWGTTQDLGAVYTCRIVADLRVTSFSAIDLWDSRPGNVDDWESVDGNTGTGLTHVQLQIRTTQDDPGGTPTWTAWTPFVIADYVLRAFQLRFVITTDDVSYNGQVQQATLALDLPARLETGTITTLSGADTTITYAQRFWATPAKPALTWSAQSGDYPEFVSQSATGFSFNIRNAGNRVVRDVDYYTQGFGKGA